MVPFSLAEPLAPTLREKVEKVKKVGRNCTSDTQCTVKCLRHLSKIIGNSKTYLHLGFQRFLQGFSGRFLFGCFCAALGFAVTVVLF